jgi:hypothetical protein
MIFHPASSSPAGAPSPPADAGYLASLRSSFDLPIEYRVVTI